MATYVRKRKNNKWWVLSGGDKIVSGPYDTKQEAEQARGTGR